MSWRALYADKTDMLHAIEANELDGDTKKERRGNALSLWIVYTGDTVVYFRNK